MKIFKTKKNLVFYLKNKVKNKSIGFVPTMGCLHQGHLELINKSKKLSDYTICSIFVNPTQFNDSNDLFNYPKNLENDILQLKSINCDCLFIPSIKEVYSNNLIANNYNFNGLDKVLEGKFRANHFNGVATIVEKLFDLIKPTFSFFGEKDLQQLFVIKSLVKQKKINTKVISVKTVRDEHGLALSSRNELLSKEEKKIAAYIYQSLLFCKKESTNYTPMYLKKLMIQKFNNNKILKLEYLSFIKLPEFSDLTKWEPAGKNAICIAAYINKVRLIDNIIL